MDKPQRALLLNKKKPDVKHGTLCDAVRVRSPEKETPGQNADCWLLEAGRGNGFDSKLDTSSLALTEVFSNCSGRFAQL